MLLSPLPENDTHAVILWLYLPVGNIPYDATEEQLKEVFSAVGEIVSFRLVFDRDTGKPKGFGFCEYKVRPTTGTIF